MISAQKNCRKIVSHTHAVRTRILPVALGPQLVALVTRPTDSSSNRSRVTSSMDIAMSAIDSCSRHSIVRMLTLLHIWVPSRLRALLKLLLLLLHAELGILGHAIHAIVAHMVRGNMSSRQHICNRQSIVGGIAMERIGEHLHDERPRALSIAFDDGTTDVGSVEYC